jgi:DNA topoisomerase-2
MAQDFIGTNNLNLLVPSGQFGTRLQGGSDAASARYIYTRLAPVTRLIFHPFDDPILQYLEEDGQKIEPKFYAPIIPMVLVNGAAGIGTGWSTDVPNYDPLAIIANLRLFLQKKKMKPMKPWYRGFTGSIEHISKSSYYSWGRFKENEKGLEITELPVRKWTQDYKEFLHTMLPGSDKPSKFSLQDVREYHTENKVHFDLKINPEEMTKIREGGVEHTMKLWSTISETNMVLFDSEGRIKKYKSALEIIEEFAAVRLSHYDTRKKYLMHKLTLERDLLSNRARFIALIVAKKLQINNRKKVDVVKDLTRLKFQKFGETRPPRSGFEYLLIMQIVSLTKERKEELERMAKQKAAELEKIKRTPIDRMWTEDLDRLEEAINNLYAQTDDEPIVKGKKRKALQKTSASRRGAKGRGQSKKKPDDEEEDLSDEEKEDTGDMDNPFSDISRWTAGALNSAIPSGAPRKKRRT